MRWAQLRLKQEEQRRLSVGLSGKCDTRNVLVFAKNHLKTKEEEKYNKAMSDISIMLLSEGEKKKSSPGRSSAVGSASKPICFMSVFVATNGIENHFFACSTFKCICSWSNENFFSGTFFLCLVRSYLLPIISYQRVEIRYISIAICMGSPLNRGGDFNWQLPIESFLSPYEPAEACIGINVAIFHALSYVRSAQITKDPLNELREEKEESIRTRLMRRSRVSWVKIGWKSNFYANMDERMSFPAEQTRTSSMRI